MNLETFFDKFDLFADAPDAVGKLRGLVLEMAVQGRLSAPLPGDDTVPSETEFRENAAALASSLGLRSPKESIEEAEPPFDVPPHWRWTALADIGAAQTGTTPSKNDHDAFNGEIPFIKPADILPDSINYSNESLTRHGAESGSRLAPSGSLLMVCIGTIGKCNLIERECAFNQQINSLTPVASVDPRYLLVAARSRSFQDAAWKKSSSTTIAILNKGKWLSIPVPLPPFAEQKRIVAKVDELMALCDRLETQQRERETRHATLARASLARFADAPTPANLNFIFHKSYDIAPADLRKSILTLAVQGKLVPQDPNDEPVEELIERIQSERAKQEADGVYKSSKSLPPIGEAEEPFPLPLGWQWYRLRALVFTLGDGLHGTPEYSEGTDCHFINGNNLVDGRIVIKPHTKTVSSAEMQKHRKQMNLNTVLVSINGTLGSVAFYNNENVILGKSACYFNLVSLVDKHFVRRVIESSYFVNYAIENATGTTIRNLGLKAMNYFPVPLPPLAEQCRIVAKVDELMALVNVLGTQLATARTTAEKLMEAVVAELTA